MQGCCLAQQRDDSRLVSCVLSTTDMLRRFLVLALAAAGPALCASTPNIVYILADDLGYADLSDLYENNSTAGNDVVAPNLVNMAKNGMTFDSEGSLRPHAGHRRRCRSSERECRADTTAALAALQTTTPRLCALPRAVH